MRREEEEERKRGRKKDTCRAIKERFSPSSWSLSLSLSLSPCFLSPDRGLVLALQFGGRNGSSVVCPALTLSSFLSPAHLHCHPLFEKGHASTTSLDGCPATCDSTVCVSIFCLGPQWCDMRVVTWEA